MHPGTSNLKGPVERRALFDEVADRLRHRIHTQDLMPGHRLDEIRLCSEFNVSRTPLREALKVLQSEGLVTLVPRQGCFVTEISDKDLADIFSVLMVLEEASTLEAVACMTAADLRRLSRLSDRLEAYAESNNLDQYIEANNEFHKTIYSIAGNRWRDGVIRDMRRLQSQFRHRSLNLAGRLEESVEEHRLLIAAFEKRDATLAASLMRQHIHNQWLALQRLSTVSTPADSARPAVSGASAWGNDALPVFQSLLDT